ncbi:alpha/beta fold hydrolase [Agrococcus beijingensis]|uniref:alpha/beta fold hydrolase n=1 Tax=Agrococcus beijingensis TaxID=3068634 RepID=UPI0027427DE1|nr:alpha/beta fold hydrolase [Agrococcus sp. REN33]
MKLTSSAPMPQVAGVTHHRIAVGDLDMHVAEAGAGTPVVLLHGSPQHWYEWQRVVPALSVDHRLLMPDLRGAGWTDGPGSGFDLDTQVHDVLGLLDAMGLDRPVLVTHDYSAIIGWRIAFDHAERIAGLVALGAGHPWLRPTLAMLPMVPKLWFQPVLAVPGLGPLAARSGRQGTVRYMLDWPEPTFDEAERQAYLAVWREPQHARGLSGIYRRLILPAMARLSRGEYDGRHLSVPTRAVLAGKDPVVTEQTLGRWRGTADDLRISTAAGAGHYIAGDRPDAVAAAVRELTAVR